MGSCEILQGSWKQTAIKFLTSWKKCGGKLEKVCAKLRASQVQFRAMCRKSLCKCTENEEAGKVQSCTSVQKCAQYLYKSTENCRKLMEKTHGNVLKTHESALYLINNAREARYFCVKMTKKMTKKCVECIENK